MAGRVAMLFESLLCLWILAIYFPRGSDYVVEASVRKTRTRKQVDLPPPRDKFDRNVFTKKKFRNGGTVKRPRGFLCLRLVRINSYSRGLVSDEYEDLFSCTYKKNNVLFDNRVRVVDQDIDFMRKVASGEGLFLKGASLQNGRLIDIPKKKKFRWGKITYSALENRTPDTASSRRVTLNRSALIFHITTLEGVSTMPTPAEMSAAIFGGQKSMNSQYLACSNNQVSFKPAKGQNIVNGVVEVTIDPGTTDYVNEPEIVSNNAMIEAGKMGIDVESYDYLLFSMPEEPFVGGNEWAGMGDIRGRKTWYRQDYILDVGLAVHELGHNIGLTHSRENKQTYGDATCSMGDAGSFACFNGAKLNQLGWFKNREVVVDPKYQSFSGGIIGINDVAFSSVNDMLVLQIVDENNSDNNLYITYNKAEGVNVETGEYRNQIVVVKKLPGFGGDPSPESQLLYNIPKGSSQIIEDFYKSQDLTISFDGTNANGSVDYATVTVQLEDKTCASDGDCDDSNSCSLGKCSNSVCSYTLKDNCCGNSVCEFDSFTETLSSCPLDCFSPLDGRVIDIRKCDYEDLGNNGNKKITTYFNIQAKKDTSISSIIFYLAIAGKKDQAGVQREISVGTKLGLWESTSEYTSSFSGSVTSEFEKSNGNWGEVHLMKVNPLKPAIFSSGGLYSVMVQIGVRWDDWLEGWNCGNSLSDDTVQLDDTDLIVYEGKLCIQDTCKNVGMTFIHAIEYMYPDGSLINPTPTNPVPSPKPNPSPTAPTNPSPTSPTNPSVVAPTVATLTVEKGGIDKVFGFMFNVKAKKSLAILQFKVRVDKIQTDIKIYSRAGNTLSKVIEDWGPVYHEWKGKGNGSEKDLSLGNFVCPINVATGGLHSFHILGNKKTMYSTKVEEPPNNPYKKNDYIVFQKQLAVKNSEGKTSKNYIWNGKITYQYGPSSLC